MSSFLALYCGEEIYTALRAVCDSFTMAPLLPLLVAAFLHVLAATKTEQPQLCIDAEKECIDDFFCAFSFVGFDKNCPYVVRGIQMDYVPNAQTAIPRNCSSDCVNAIKKLKSTRKGAALYTCDCYRDGGCLTMKARVAKCLNVDDTALKKPSCTMANANCSGDSHCQKLRTNFLLACNKMISGVECENECLEAQKTLAKNQHGKVLYNCECDGATESLCRGLEANAKQLRCLPGMDGSGKPGFDIIHSTEVINVPETDNSSSMPVFSRVLSWTLVLLLAYLVM